MHRAIGRCAKTDENGRNQKRAILSLLVRSSFSEMSSVLRRVILGLLFVSYVFIILLAYDGILIIYELIHTSSPDFLAGRFRLIIIIRYQTSCSFYRS